MSFVFTLFFSQLLFGRRFFSLLLLLLLLLFKSFFINFSSLFFFSFFRLIFLFRVCASICFPVCFLCLVNYSFSCVYRYGAMGRSALALDERRHKSLLFKHIFKPLHLFSLFTFNWPTQTEKKNILYNITEEQWNKKEHQECATHCFLPFLWTLSFSLSLSLPDSQFSGHRHLTHLPLIHMKSFRTHLRWIQYFAGFSLNFLDIFYSFHLYDTHTVYFDVSSHTRTEYD